MWWTLDRRSVRSLSGERTALLAAVGVAVACGGEVRRGLDQEPITTGEGVAAVGGEGDSRNVGAVSMGGVATSAAANASNASNANRAASTLSASATSGAPITSGSGGASAGGASAGGASVGGASAGGAGGSVSFTCSNPRELLVGGFVTGIDACDEGYEVRAEQVACPNLLPAKGEGGAASGAECTSHQDCPGLAFCQQTLFGDFCAEGCESDSDCDPGNVCRCGDPIGLCSPATCTSSVECGPDSVCAAVVEQGCSTIYHYACLTESDECQSDGDCIDVGRGDWCNLVDAVRRCDTRRPCR